MSESAQGPLIRRTSARDGLRLAWAEHPPAAPESPPGRPPEHPPAPLKDVVCLSGMTGNSREFLALAGWLAARGRRVICPDYRGRGLSGYDSNPANYRVETHLDDLRSVLTAAGVHKPVVIGTSLGGVIAMAMGAFMPGLIAGALINDIGPEIKLRALDGTAARFRAQKTFADWKEAAAYMQSHVSGFSSRSDEDWITAARAAYREGRDGRLTLDCDPAFRRVLDDRTRPDNIEIWPLFNSLGRVPAAVVRGTESQIFPAELVARMAESRARAPGGALIQAVAPGAGHAPNLNEPESREAVSELLTATG